MRLIDDWRKILNKAWSMRFAMLGAGLAVAEQVVPQLNGLIPPLVYAGLSVAVVAARMIPQPKMHDDTDQTPK
jgi:hypothetical protein